LSGRAIHRTVPFVFFLLVGALSFSGVDLSPDHRKIEPMALATDDPPVVAAQRKMMGASGYPGLPAPVFIHMKSDDPALPARLSNLGGTGSRIHSRLYTAQIPRDASRYISNWPQVAFIESAKRARPLLDLSRPAVSADIVQAGIGLPAPFTGAGMYVGVVDSGLSGAHLDFHTAGQGSPSRVVHTYSYSGSVDPLIDGDGHGTHVSGIAAGNGFSSAGKYTGMAPDAGILFGKTSFFTTDIIIAVDNLIRSAEADFKPIPVNLSLGLMLGPHDGSSGFENGIHSLATGPLGSRRLIAVAAGNETGANEHFQANLAPFELGLIPIALDNNTTSATVYLWADGNDQYTVTASMGSETVSFTSGNTGSSPGGRISISNRFGGPHPLNGATFISVIFRPLGGGSATIRLDRTRNGGTGKLDAYIEDVEGTFSVSTDSDTITEPANGSAVIAVGSFDTKTTGGFAATQNISSFSSLGPTRDGRLKPDVTAPGFVLYSAKSLDRTWQPSQLVPGNDNYVIMAGTSMATPHVTGIAALVWQSNPDLTGAQMRERIKRTADPATDGSTPPPNTTWGYGKVNALAAVKNSVASINAPATAVPGSPVSLTSENSSGTLGNSLTSYAWSLTVKPAGSGASLSAPSSASSGFTPDVPGSYTVVLTVSQATPASTPAGNATATIHVNGIPSVTSVTGPASSDNLAPVSFNGTGTDPDGQPLAFHWILVSRPADSASTLSTADVDNVTFAPDVAGTYEIGLRVDDGLDNSALAVHDFTVALPSSSAGGSGGCSVANRKDAPVPSESASTVLFLLIPAGLLAARRRIIRTRPCASRVLPPGRPAGP
jgi:subtilisin family serine protease